MTLRRGGSVLITLLVLGWSQFAVAQTETADPDTQPAENGGFDLTEPIPLVLDQADPAQIAAPDISEQVIDPDAPDQVLDPFGQIEPAAPPTGIEGLGRNVLANTVTSTAVAVKDASGALLRGLDKVSGTTTDFNLQNGQSINFGELKVTLDDCRFPADNPSADAFAHIDVAKNGASADQQALFSGWMIASSPALSALDHPRYDVWVVRCKSS